MTRYRLLRRLDYEKSSSHLPENVRRKATWAQVLLGTRGRTPTVKNTSGQNAQWRRTPVQGSHYYLWWIPASESGIDLERREDGDALLVHSIRHHDETDTPIEIGQPDQYAPVDLGLLDPRFEDQAAIGREAEAADFTLSVVEGMPGSGKSVALLYLARDLAFRPGVRKVRYITYTERLKRTAREIFDALGPEIAKHITVHTINDVVKSLLEKEIGKESAGRDTPLIASTPYAELRAFTRAVEVMNPRDLGAWRDYPLTLYTELRAEVVGRTFPAGYQLPIHREEQLRRHGAEIDVGRYARQRGLDARSAQQAVEMANRLRGRYFTDQTLAARALDKVVRGEIPSWLAHTDAIIVDEVQDLTLVQIALIAEMARLRVQKHPDKPLAVTVAGDESQIVQPTGFKWGVTKDLLRERLGVLPARHEFAEQRRSPALLARMISGSWSLYAALPKELRPSARQPDAAATLDGDDTEPGLAAIAPPPTDDDQAWRDLLQELAARPGRALIDLTEELHERLYPDEDGAGSEIIFAAREIKGLERSTILVHGLETLYQRIVDLTDGDDGDRIQDLEARRLIDQMRVALSRSTSRLILIEDPAAAVFAEIDFDPEADAFPLTFAELVDFLHSEEMTEVEMIYGLLGEADDLADRERIDEAIRRNRRAAAVAGRIGAVDLALGVDQQYGALLLLESERLLAQGQIAAAQETFQTREELPPPDDEETLERAGALGKRLAAAADSEFDRLLEVARRALRAHDHEAAVAAAERALHIAEQAQVPGRFEAAAETFAAALEAWGLALAAQREPELSAQIAGLLRRQSAVTESLERPAQAQALRVLAARYDEIPARNRFTDLQMLQVFEAILTHRRALNSPLAENFAHCVLWLDETFADLKERFKLYYAWASAAALVAETGCYPAFDEHLWELENRLESAGNVQKEFEVARFRAFLADSAGDAAAASRLWEQIGEMDKAIASARAAADLERAYALMRRQNAAPVPDALATAVKALRLLQQMEQKHRGLTAGERRALLEELARVHAAIAATMEEE